LTENREYIYHAGMPDPHAAANLDFRQIRVLVDDLIAAHADWLPRWITEEKAA
jgi:alpha-galactosidase